MQLDRVQPLAAIWSQWQDLERDWQSVALGTALVLATVLLDLHVPW